MRGVVFVVVVEMSFRAITRPGYTQAQAGGRLVGVRVVDITRIVPRALLWHGSHNQCEKTHTRQTVHLPISDELYACA